MTHAPIVAASAPGRPPEIELWSNRVLIHPLSRALVAELIRTPVTPNMVSVAGAAAAAAAAAAYTLPPWPGSAFAGLALCGLWHVLDGADGDLARRTGRSSTVGELIDGICDYLGRIVLYLALATFCARQIGPWAWPLAVFAGLSRFVQANAYETARRTYRRWAYGVGWIRQTLDAAPPPRGLFARAGRALGRVFLAVSLHVTPDDAALEQAVAASTARRGADETQAICRATLAPGVRRGAILATNAETVAIFLAMLAGGPLWLFLYTAAGLNAAYVAFYLDQRRRFAAAVAALNR